MARKSVVEIAREISLYLASNRQPGDSKFISKLSYDPNPEESEIVKKAIAEEEILKNMNLENSVPLPGGKKKSLPGNFRCAVKGAGGVECGGMRCVAHVITRQDHALTAAVENRVLLCKEHELWFNKQDPRIWYRYVKENFPDKFQAVRKRYEFVIKEFEIFMEVANE